MRIKKITLRLLIFFYIIPLNLSLEAQEIPKIIAFDREMYRANHQNWMITSDCNGLIFSANSDGVLIFNGFDWQLIPLPNNRKARSIFKGKDCRIYVGGYETFGYIDMTNRYEPKFVPIGDSIFLNSAQEIWNIYGDEDKIIFQSFSTLYEYDYKSIEVKIPPTNIMFGKVIHGQNILPKIEGGLFRVLGDSIITMEESLNLPNDSKVAAICPGWGIDEILIGTQYHGLYSLKNGKISNITNVINELISKEQVNRMQKLKNGYVAIGTILNGLYVVNSKFDIIYHINKSNGLSNNTVLSLFESDNGDLWVGLDKGINLLKISDPINYYYDISGQLGTFFCHAFYKNEYYIGTNQGVFKQTDKYSYRIIPGTQGQAWCLREIDNQLFCGLNSGAYIIKENHLQNIYSSTGVWWMEKSGQNKILQSTYTGLSLLELIDNEWHALPSFDTLGIILQRFLLKDHTIYGYNPQNEAIIVELNGDNDSIISVNSISELDGISISSNLHFLPLQDSIYAVMGDMVFGIQNQEFTQINDQILISQIKNDANYTSYLISQKIGESVPRFYDYHITSDNYLLGINEGFVSVPNTYRIKPEQDSIYLDYLNVNGSYFNLSNQSNVILSHYENDLIFHLGIKSVPDRFNTYEYQLENWKSQWFPLEENGTLEFYNLPSNEYTLKIKNNLTGQYTELLKITIKPVWYTTWKGYLLLIIIIFSILRLISRRHEKKLKEEKIKLENEKTEELEKERIRSRNERLERELTHKRKLLANSALTIAQKNKMLNKLKSFVQTNSISGEESGKNKQKLLHLIEKNLNSDHEWEIFEQNFAEVHDDFLDNLKNNYPDLTPGDLRLAAYIKMGLSSKEISPLLNISVRSVENKRYRLRKKMELSGEDNLSDQLMRY